MGGVRGSGNTLYVSSLTIHQKITFKFAPIVASECGRLTKDRNELCVDGSGDGISLFVGEEGHQREFAKTIYHG